MTSLTSNILNVHSLRLGDARMVVFALKSDTPDPYTKGVGNQVMENIFAIKASFGMVLVTDDKLIRHHFNTFSIRRLHTDASGKVTAHGILTESMLGYDIEESLDVEFIVTSHGKILVPTLVPLALVG